MTLLGNRNETRTSSVGKKSISSHRAFVYGASAPGLGEIYAGSRIRGIMTASLVIFFGIWFTRVLVVIIGDMVDRVFDSLNDVTPIVVSDLPLISVGISFQQRVTTSINRESFSVLMSGFTLFLWKPYGIDAKRNSGCSKPLSCEDCLMGLTCIRSSQTRGLRIGQLTV